LKHLIVPTDFNLNKMEKRYSGIPQRYMLSFLLLCFCISGYTIGIERNGQIQIVPGIQKDLMSAFGQKLFQPEIIPGPVNAINAGTKNILRLDSMYEERNTGYTNAKRKWFYHYENNKLKSVDHFFYTDTFSTRLNVQEAWYYNDEGQVLSYEKKDKLIATVDSLFTVILEENSYKDGLLMEKQTKKAANSGSGTHVVNGVSVPFYHVNYSENTTHYLYNERKLLIKDYIEGSNDTNCYRYDAQDRLLFEIRKNPVSNYLEVTKFTYEETDTSKFDTEKYVVFNRTADEAVIDTITVWEYEYSFDYTLDDQHRTSVLNIKVNYWDSRNSSEAFKTYYDYSPSGKKKYISIYYGAGAIGAELECKEQARIEYSYDENDNLTVYHVSYYDDQLKGWRTQELKTYFYSSTKSTTGKTAVEQKEFTVYPNPATENICLSWQMDAGSKYIIYNLSGSTVKQGVIDNHQIAIADLERGNYFIRVYNNTSSHLSRFVKY